MRKLLYITQNGKHTVMIYDDGTKIINGFDYESSPFVLPVSMDVKITNRCDLGCSFCHEKSTKKGKQKDLMQYIDLLKQLYDGTELAL
jgi:MoaA/NifB/PqqE/SkfB family radical SAM enzyme